MPRSQQPFHPTSKRLPNGKWEVDCRAWRDLLRSWGLPVRPRFSMEADALHRVRELDAYYLMGGPPAVRERIPLADARELFLQARNADGLSWQTLLKYRMVTREFLGYARTRSWGYLDQIGTPQVIAFKLNQTALGLSHRTVHLHCSVLRVFLSFAVRMGFLETNPMVGAMPARPTRQANRALTNEERLAIWGFGGKRGPLWRLMLVTGCRRSEVCKLSERSFAFAAIPQPFVRLDAKGRVRSFPLTSMTVELAREFVRVAPTLRSPASPALHSDSVWAAEYSDTLLSISPQTLNRWWGVDRDAMKLARDVVLHTLRHDFATTVVERAGVRSAQQLLGHADIRTTVQYDHTSDEALAAAAGVVGTFLVQLAERKAASAADTGKNG